MSAVINPAHGPSLLSYGQYILNMAPPLVREKLHNELLNLAKSNANMCKNPHFNGTINIGTQYLNQFAAEYAIQCAAERAEEAVFYIVGGIVLTGAIAYGAYKAYNELKKVVSAPLVTTDLTTDFQVKLALQSYNDGGIKNNLKSRVCFAIIAFFATGRAIANIAKTIFFALTGINANRRDSMRINARAAIVEIKLATHANLGVIAPSLAQRVQNRA